MHIQSSFFPVVRIARLVSHPLSTMCPPVPYAVRQTQGSVRVRMRDELGSSIYRISIRSEIDGLTDRLSGLLLAYDFAKELLVGSPRRTGRHGQTDGQPDLRTDGRVP